MKELNYFTIEKIHMLYVFITNELVNGVTNFCELPIQSYSIG